MSKFHAIYGKGGVSPEPGLVTKFEKTVTISSAELAEISIDISADVLNYKDVTNERIIVELNNVNAIAAGDAELSHAYNAETGVITITSTNSSIPFASSSTTELSLNVYVAGAVQIPPAPVIDGYEIAEGYATINASSIFNMVTRETESVSIDTKILLGTSDDIIICGYVRRGVAGADIGKPYATINNASPMVSKGDDYNYILFTGVGLNSEEGGYGTLAILKSSDGVNPFSVSAVKSGDRWNSGFIFKLSPKK